MSSPWAASIWDSFGLQEGASPSSLIQSITAEPEVAPLMLSICWNLWHRNGAYTEKGDTVGCCNHSRWWVGVIGAMNLLHPLSLCRTVSARFMGPNPDSWDLSHIRMSFGTSSGSACISDVPPFTLPFDSCSPKEGLKICSDLFSPVKVLCLNPD